MATGPSKPRDPEAFARMLRDSAAAIDRARAAGSVSFSKPRRPAGAAPNASTGAAPRPPKGPPATPIWPPATRAAPRAAERTELPNPYDLLQEHSRAQERAAAKIPNDNSKQLGKG